MKQIAHQDVINTIMRASQLKEKYHHFFIKSFWKKKTKRTYTTKLIQHISMYLSL